MFTLMRHIKTLKKTIKTCHDLVSALAFILNSPPNAPANALVLNCNAMHGNLLYCIVM